MPVALATASVSFDARTAKTPVTSTVSSGASVAVETTVTQLTETAAPTPTPSLDWPDCPLAWPLPLETLPLALGRVEADPLVAGVPLSCSCAC